MQLYWIFLLSNGILAEHYWKASLLLLTIIIIIILLSCSRGTAVRNLRSAKRIHHSSSPALNFTFTFTRVRIVLIDTEFSSVLGKPTPLSLALCLCPFLSTRSESYVRLIRCIHIYCGWAGKTVSRNRYSSFVLRRSGCYTWCEIPTLDHSGKHQIKCAN